MNLSPLDKAGLIIIILIFWFASVVVTFIFLENKQTNELISKCISETKDHLACKNLYDRR